LGLTRVAGVQEMDLAVVHAGWVALTHPCAPGFETTSASSDPTLTGITANGSLPTAALSVPS
jgi:hypothetical protein